MTDENLAAILSSEKFTAESIDRLLLDLRDQLKMIKALSESPLPDDSEEFRRIGFKYAVKGIDLAGFSVRAHYDRDEARRDAMRIVKADQVERLIRSAEEDLISFTVKSPATLFLGPFIATFQTFFWILKNRKALDLAIKALSKSGVGVMSSLGLVIVAALALSLPAITVAEITKGVVATLKLRDFYVAEVRKLTLEQRAVGRVKREKRSRRN